MITKKIKKVLIECFFDDYESFKKEVKVKGFNSEKWRINKYNFEFRENCIYVTAQIENAGPFSNTGFTLSYKEVEERFKKQNKLKYMLLHINK